MTRSQQKVLVDFDNALMASIIEKEKERPARKKDDKAAVTKPKRVGSKTWDYTRARYIGGDC